MKKDFIKNKTLLEFLILCKNYSNDLIIKYTISSLFSLVLLFISPGCSKDYNEEDQKVYEQKEIIDYLEENKINATPTASGLYIIRIDSGQGLIVDSTDYVVIQYEARLISGEIFSTSNPKIAIEKDIYSEFILYGPHKFAVWESIPGIIEGLLMMNEGDSVKLIIPSDLAFEGQGFGQIPPYTPLIYDIRLLEVIKDPVKHENELIRDYFSKNNIYNESLLTTSSGLYYIESVEGKGVYPRSGDTLNIHYQATLLDGREIESTYGNGPFSFIFKEDGLIEGFEEGIGLMHEGGTATLIIPYYLAH
ncbi:MAG: FKBP-type peptidyl-prolyl cis-trans isomerase, partial [bacterium]